MLTYITPKFLGVLANASSSCFFLGGTNVVVAHNDWSPRVEGKSDRHKVVSQVPCHRKLQEWTPPNMVKPAANWKPPSEVMLVTWDMFCQIALECLTFQVCKLGSSGQGSDGLRFGPFWQQLMKMVHRNIQMLVYRFWDAYRNKCETKFFVQQSFNPTLKNRAFCWKRNFLVKANCLTPRDIIQEVPL